MTPCSALCPFTACHTCQWKADLPPEQRQDALEDLVDELFKMPEVLECTLCNTTRCDAHAAGAQWGLNYTEGRV